MIVLGVIFAAVMVGWLAGGDLRALARVSLRGGGVAAAAGVSLGLAALLRLSSANLWAGLFMVMAAVLAGAFGVANSRVPGLAVAASGVALNIMVSVINSGMPVAGVGVVADVRHAPVADGTRLLFLGDVLRVPLGERGVLMVSIGDALLLVGVAAAIVALMTLQARDGSEEGMN